MVPVSGLRCPTLSLARTPASMVDRCTTGSPCCICPRQRRAAGPDSHLRFESDRKTKKADTHLGICFFGAGDRTRTGTLSLAVDFESTTSTNSITPADVKIFAAEFDLIEEIVTLYRLLLRFPTLSLLRRAASMVDRGHSLRSLLPPPAALPSLPNSITPAGACVLYNTF